MILRFHVIQLTTPDALRGRVSAVNAMFAIGGSQFGQLEAGLVAALTTPQIALISGGIMCLLTTLFFVVRVPLLLRVHIHAHTEDHLATEE